MKNYAMFLMSLAAAGIASAQPNTLYIADPEANAIYVRHSDGTDSSTEVLSGTLGISTNDVAFLSPDMVLFQPLQKQATLAAVDLESGILEHVAEYAEGERVTAIGRGPEGEGTFLLTSEGQLAIGEARREMGTGNWQVVTKQIPNPGQFNGYVSLLKSAPDTYFLAYGNAGMNGPHSLALIQTGEEPVVTALGDSTGGHRLYRNSIDGRVLVISGTSNVREIDVYTPDGTPVSNPAVANSQALRLNHATAEWNAGPEIALITHGRLLGEDAPFSAAPTELFSATIGGVLDPNRDPGGAIAMVRSGETAWSYYDVVRSEIIEIDSSDGSQERRLTRTFGEGPAFGQIQAMMVGPDGDLHVLCADLVGYRILMVDTLTGNRTLRAELPIRLVQETLALDPEGNYLIMTRGFDADNNPEYTTWRVPSNGGELVELYTSPGPNTLEDIELQPDGSALALSRISGRTTLESLGPDGRERLNGVTANVTNFQQTANEGNVHTFEGTVSVPPDFSGIAVDRVRVLITLDPPQTPAGQQGAMPHSLIAPDGTPYIWEAPLNGFLNEQNQSELAVEHFIGTDSISAAGEWKITTTLPSQISTSATPVATIELIGANRTVQFAQRADGTLALLGSIPASLRNLDPTTSTITPAPLSLPADEAYKYFDKTSDIIEDVDGGGLFVASNETPLVYRVDAAGQASVYTSGRPIDVNAHLMGLSPYSRMLIAVGPKAEPDLRPSGWLLE